MTAHLFVAGVPATGKTWLGSWLAENKGYIHIDAEIPKGVDFDRAGVHNEWNEVVATGRAESFVKALDRIGSPVVVSWGFLTRYLYIVRALQVAGVSLWWLSGGRQHARAAFVRRGGIDPLCFDVQMDTIAREWSLIAVVFGTNIVDGLHPDGSQKHPEAIWSAIAAAGY
jgi:hypothetical protein